MDETIGYLFVDDGSLHLQFHFQTNEYMTKQVAVPMHGITHKRTITQATLIQ